MTEPDDSQQLADFKRALDHAAIVAITDVKGRITYVNDKFCEISGYPRQELLGQDHRIINSGYHPAAFIRDLWVTVANGHVWQGELRNRAKDGHVYWVDTTIVPFLDSTGKPYQYIAIRADITPRKDAEARLVEQAALAQVGQLAAVVAHEVRNPLAGIKGAVQVLISRRPADDPEVAVMKGITERIDGLSELINDLMVFSRPRSLEWGRVDLLTVANDVVSLTHRDAAAGHVDIVIAGNPVTIRGDLELVRAALLNLVINAAQAMGGQGRIDITIAGDGTAGALITVRDSGPGMPAERLDRAFEPFFTTKARGGGLGLPIARRTAERHGGTLTLACPPGGGTVATLSLPCDGSTSGSRRPTFAQDER